MSQSCMCGFGHYSWTGWKTRGIRYSGKKAPRICLIIVFNSCFGLRKRSLKRAFLRQKPAAVLSSLRNDIYLSLRWIDKDIIVLELMFGSIDWKLAPIHLRLALYLAGNAGAPVNTAYSRVLLLCFLLIGGYENESVTKQILLKALFLIKGRKSKPIGAAKVIQIKGYTLENFEKLCNIWLNSSP